MTRAIVISFFAVTSLTLTAIGCDDDSSSGGSSGGSAGASAGSGGSSNAGSGGSTAAGSGGSAGSSAGGSGGSSSNGSWTDATSPDDFCAKLCAFKPPITCPNDNPATCAAECDKDIKPILGKCLSQGNAFGKCGVSTPASGWECDADGEANLKDASCSAEMQALIACASAGG